MHDTIRVILPFEDQISADIVSNLDLSLKQHTTIQFVFVKETKKQNHPLKISSVLCIVFNAACVMRVM